MGSGELVFSKYPGDEDAAGLGMYLENHWFRVLEKLHHLRESLQPLILSPPIYSHSFCFHFYLVSFSTLFLLKSH